jgi:hypothetical protein
MCVGGAQRLGEIATLQIKLPRLLRRGRVIGILSADVAAGATARMPRAYTPGKRNPPEICMSLLL